MTDVTKVSFTLDGYLFTKSIEQAEEHIRDLEYRIWAAKHYGNLPYEEGRLDKEDVCHILTSSGILHGLDNDSERAVTVDDVWERVCTAAGSAIIQPIRRRSPDEEPDDEPRDSRSLDIREFRLVIAKLLTKFTEDDSFTIKHCLQYLEERLYNALRAAQA